MGKRRFQVFSIPAGRAGVYLSACWALLAAGLSLKVFHNLPDIVRGFLNEGVNGPDITWRGVILAASGHSLALLAPPVILLAAWGAGGPADRLVRAGPPLRGGISPAPVRADRGIDRIFLRLILGFGVLSLTFQGLGYPGLYQRSLLALAGSGFILSGWWSWWREKPWRVFHVADFTGSKFPLLAVGLLLLEAFLLARLPDTGEDARLYHLAAPEAYLFLHRIFAVSGHFAWHMPLGAEMLYLPAYALGGIDFAKQVNVAVFALMLGMAWRLAVALGTGGWLAPVIAGTAGLAMGECWEVKNDILVALYVSASAFCLIRGLGGRRRMYLPAAVLAGLALGVKFTAGLAVAGLAAGTAVAAGRRPRAGTWLVLAAVALVPLAGWLTASWLFLGNPFHPFLSGIFSDLGWGPFYMEGLNRQALAISPESALSAWDWLGGAWRAFGSWDLGSAVIFWMLPPVLLARRGRGGALIPVCAAVAYLLWLPSNRNVRYLFFLIPLMSALAAGIPARSGFFAGWTGGMRRWMTAFSLAGVVMVGLFLVSPAGLSFLLGKSSRERVLEARYSTWEDMRLWVNRHVPLRGRVLFNGEERRLWFAPRVVSTGPVYEPFFWRATRESSSPQQVRKRLREEGVTHLVHEFLSSQFRRLLWFAGPEWDNRQLRLYREFMAEYGEIIRIPGRVDMDNGGFYVVRFRDQPVPGTAWFLPSTEGRWLRSLGLLSGGEVRAARKAAEADFDAMRGVYQVRFILGTLAVREGDWAGAIRLMRPGAEAGFVDNGIWNYYGAALLKTGDFNGAIRALGRAVMLQGDPGSRRQLSGAFLERMKKRGEAGDLVGASRDRQAARFILF